MQICILQTNYLIKFQVAVVVVAYTVGQLFICTARLQPARYTEELILFSYKTKLEINSVQTSTKPFKCMLLFPGIKMKVEYCTLTNATFENNIRHTFKRLKEEELHFDMSIYCSGQIMQAHKIVVSASSGFFSEVLSHISHSKPLIVLNHMSPSLITNMLNFICHGEICLSTKENTSFLEAAVELKIVGLSHVHASEDDVLSQTESGENQLKQEN